MSSFFDATCANCGRRIAWRGKLSDQPSCPKCGHKPSKKDLEAVEQEMREAEEEILDARNSLKEKVQHVKTAKQDRIHHCHWPGCGEQVPPAMWGCRKHWLRLPKALRDKIWMAYRPGQEKDMRPSREYLAVAKEVQEWIRKSFPGEV